MNLRNNLVKMIQTMPNEGNDCVPCVTAVNHYTILQFVYFTIDDRNVQINVFHQKYTMSCLCYALFISDVYEAGNFQLEIDLFFIFVTYLVI